MVAVQLHFSNTNMDSAFSKLPGNAKSSWVTSHFGNEWASLARPFCSKPAGSDVIGIGLGTTNSCVAVMEGKDRWIVLTPEVIEHSEGSRTTPSVVAFNQKGELLVSTPAKWQAVTNPTNTGLGTKRLIGRRFDDPLVQKEMQMVPYKIVRAYFNDAQRQATKDAGRIAGLDVEKITNERTAAALSYGLNNKEGLVAVFDLGDGTFDVKATNGDTFLGEEDFDSALLEYLVSEFERTKGIDLSEDRLVLQRLREAAEKAMIEMSSTTQTEINLPFITANASGAKHLDITLTRSKFESLVNHLIDRTREQCKNCLKDAGVLTKDVDEVLLVGRMTQVPKVKAVAEIFGKNPSEGVNPDEAVAMGARDLLSEVISTAADNQSRVGIKVLQDRKSRLTSMSMESSPSLAKDKTTRREQQITIRSSRGLSEAEIEMMVKEAEMHAQRDQEKKALIDVKNNADATIYNEIKAKLDAANKAVSMTGQHMPGGFVGGSSVLIMGKKSVMVPASEVDLTAVKYEPEVLQAPHMTGMWLKLFVKLIEAPLIGSLIISNLKKQNKTDQMLRNTVIPETPMFKPEFPPQEDGKPEDQVELALKCLPHYDAATCWTGDPTSTFRYWKIRDYAYAYRSRLATPSMVAERVISSIEELSNQNPPAPLLISFDAAEVRKQAAASTQRFEEGNPLSILDGIFVAIKDDIDCYPHPSKGATTWFHEVRPVKKDAVSVSRLRICGVIFVGKANMHELGLGTTGNNPNYG
ncbi:mitochondrial HSO70 2 [Actinidia rufa]|uniref:Mitochondrial HSO70 2 n=1 Tax=Actinidia rufa TaxID=165716 RepID=A0A7J0EUC8_9ERIC|nr:mitochondrial HSO70 2 [Actinidia rufa]